jgi:GntR family transcriptional regulator, transcriptional repressor for pyruvate dehydrogenase complex
MAIKEDTFKSIKKQGVVDDIVESIKRALINGDLEPGQRLPSENELAQSLEVGRNAVREAMKMLSALGIVNIKRGDGTFIAAELPLQSFMPLSFAILLQKGMTKELFEFRSLIQIGYCQLAAQNYLNEDLEEIGKILEDWLSLSRVSAKDIESLVNLDLNFHYAILNATHNPLVNNLGKAVEELFSSSIRTVISDGKGLERAIEGHQHILQAIRSRNPENIRTEVEKSLLNWEIGLSSNLKVNAIKNGAN